jgi:hypothetical protein
MFNRIESAIIKVLQDNLKVVPKENIGTKKPDFQADKNLPAISLNNIDFEIEEVGIGRVIGEEDRELQETFSGDGKKREFTLAEKQPGQLIAVEYPPGKRLKEGEDFTFDYESSMITLHATPPKSENNIVVRYLRPAKIKGFKFNLRFYLNVWATDEAQRDSITTKVVEILLREEESLNQQEIFIKPVKGFNILDGEVPEGVYGKTIEYIVKTELQVETPVPRIEKIEIKSV